MRDLQELGWYGTSLRGGLAAALLALAAAGGCRGGAPDAQLLTSEGDVALPTLTAEALGYTVTSENYRRWMMAEGALATLGVDDLSERIPLEATTEAELVRVVRAIEANDRVASAIRSSGLSVDEYVRTSIALEQALSATEPANAVRYQRVPAENIIIADRHAEDVRRVRESSPLRVEGSGRATDGDDWSARSRKEIARRDKKARKAAKGDKGRGRGNR